MKRTIWQFRGDIQVKPPAELVAAAEDSYLVAKLLMNRGLKTPEEIRHFLDLECYAPTSGLELPDMDKALDRIEQALEKSENILIYGDFDVDGITGTSILYETFQFLGAKVTFYIPDRAKEGHGLNTAACIRLASSRQVKLVITTDTGITNFAEVSLLNGLGIDTIVTDHHELPENLPPAVANVNPKILPDQSHPLAPLCGAGVAYKLSELLLERFVHRQPEMEAEAEALRTGLLDLTAIGTVADLASLLKENRYLVYEGLKVLNTRSRLGVKIILENAGTTPEASLTSETIGFTIAPRLNAIGRLDNAMDAVTLLTTHDAEQARPIASFLEQLNRKRRELCDETFLEADRALGALGGLGERRAIVLGNPRWNLGVIGIVASRLIEKYHVPVFMMLLDEENEVARCSARSIPGFHLHDELLPCTDLFDGFGGHAGAGGFKLPMKNLNLFKDRIYQITANKVTDEHMLPIVEVDDELDWSQLNPHLVDLVNKMAPFGMDNPSPKFVVNNARIVNQRGIGENEKHLKLAIASKDDKRIPAIDALYWNYGQQPKLDPNATYRFAVVPELNTFNGNTKIQLILEDIKKAGDAGSSATIAVAPVETSEIPVAVPELAQPLSVSEILSHAPKPEIEVETAARQTVAVLTETRVTENKVAVQTLEAALKTTVLDDEQGLGNQLPSTYQWVDHRGREALDAFVGQLMLPLQDKRSVLIYHEGRKPQIPFLDETLLASRRQLKKAEELILWDVPPDKASMKFLLKTVQPSTIHLVGGKFQTVPVFQTEQNYIKLLAQTLSKQQQDIDLVAFSSALGLNLPVVEYGLLLMARFGFFQVEVAQPEPLTVRLQWASTPPQVAGLDTLLEAALFKKAVSEMSQFRNWILNAELDTIMRHFGKA